MGVRFPPEALEKVNTHMEVSPSGYGKRLESVDSIRVPWVRVPPPPQDKKSDHSAEFFV